MSDEERYSKSALDKCIGYDATNKAWYLRMADPNGQSAGSDHKVMISSDDTTPAYVGAKVVGTTNRIVATETGGGASETLVLNTGSTILDTTTAGQVAGLGAITPASADVILLEDAGSSNAKGKGTVANVTAAGLGALLTEQGDIPYASADGVAATLHHGTAGYLLQSGGNAANPSWVQRPHSIQVTLGATTVCATGTKLIVFRLPYAFTLAKVRVGCVVAPTGTGDTQFTINYHATDPDSMTTVFTTGPEDNAPKLTNGLHTIDSGAPDVTALAAGGWVGIDIESVCATTSGTGWIVELLE